MMIGALAAARQAARTPPVRGAVWQLMVPGAALALAIRPFGWRGQFLALALYGVAGALALRGFARQTPLYRSFGAANIVTASRAAAVAFLLGAWIEFAVAHQAPSPDVVWRLAALAAVALASDGLDGWLARRSDRASAFGARFDMETDALLVLALALIVVATGRGAADVLLSGALRYLFVAAGWLIPALAAPLETSLRRKAICVVQTALLIVALLPPLPVEAAALGCDVGLGLLIYSFGVDVAGLVSGGRRCPIMTEDDNRDIARRPSPIRRDAPPAPGRSCHR